MEKMRLKVMKSKSPPQKDKKRKTEQPWWIRKSSDVCDFFEISPETLSQWNKKGAPKVAYGTWDIKAIIHWKYQAENGAAKRKLMAEADLKETKALQEQIKLNVQEEKYIETAKVTQDLRRLFGNIKKSFLALGHNIAAELNSLDPDAAITANKVVDETVQEALNQLSEGKNYGKSI